MRPSNIIPIHSDKNPRADAIRNRRLLLDTALRLFQEQGVVLRCPDKGLIALANPISYEPIGVALPANDALFVNWIQNVLGTLEKSGELEVLRRRWFDDSSWVSRLP